MRGHLSLPAPPPGPPPQPFPQRQGKDGAQIGSVGHGPLLFAMSTRITCPFYLYTQNELILDGMKKAGLPARVKKYEPLTGSRRLLMVQQPVDGAAIVLECFSVQLVGHQRVSGPGLQSETKQHELAVTVRGKSPHGN